MPIMSEPIEEKRTPDQAVRRPGRPRAVPDTFVPKVISLYRQGLGYRAIARELLREGLCVDWSTVRRLIKSHEAGLAPEHRPGDL